MSYERTGIDRDSEADKLGSYRLADNRHGDTGQFNLFDDEAPTRSSGVRSRKLPPTGKPLEGKHGIQESQRIAAEALQRETMTRDELREITQRGAPAVRQAFTEAMDARRPRVPTDEEIKAQRLANGKEIRRKATESWADSI